MKLLVIGGDARNVHLAARLAGAGVKDLTVTRFALGDDPDAGHARPDFGAFRWLVGPIPFSEDGVHLHTPLSHPAIAIADFLAALSPETTLFSGTIPAGFAPPCRHLDLTRHTALYDSTLVATAEGVLQTLLNHIDFTLAGARVLIAGHGKVGKTVARLLSALNAEVSVFSVDADEQHDIASRYTAAGLNDLSSYRIVINTIPAPVLSAERLRSLTGQALLLDVASFPGGVEAGAVLPAGVRLLRAPGLPGRKAPETVAAAMAAVILEQLAVNA